MHCNDQMKSHNPVYMFVLKQPDCTQCNSIRLKEFLSHIADKNKCTVFLVFETTRQEEIHKLLTEEIGINESEGASYTIVSDTKLVHKLNGKLGRQDAPSYLIVYDATMHKVRANILLKDINQNHFN